MGADRVGRAIDLHERARRLQAAGRPGEALPLAERALALLDVDCGPIHPDVANVANTVGAIREDLADYPGAERQYRRAVTTMAALAAAIDVDDPNSEPLVRIRVQSTAHLGQIRRVQGDLDTAEKLLLEALRDAESNLGPEDAEVASVLTALGIVYKYAAAVRRGRAV